MHACHVKKKLQPEVYGTFMPRIRLVYQDRSGDSKAPREAEPHQKYQTGRGGAIPTAWPRMANTIMKSKVEWPKGLSSTCLVCIINHFPKTEKRFK